jgi:hypothetical protein
LKQTWTIIAAVLAIYLLAYFLLMARNVAAVNPKTGKSEFRSSYRMAPSTGQSGPLSITTPEVSPLNYVFYPLDVIYYALAPTNRSFNSIPAH